MMFRKAGRWLVTATLLVIVGAIMFSTAMTVCGWDFTRLSTVAFETNTYAVTESFRDISIDIDAADILFAPSEDGKCSVVCREAENAEHSVSVIDGALVISETDSRTWRQHIGIFMGAQTVTVFLPESEYGAITIKESTGDIIIPADFMFESVRITTSTGDVRCDASAQGDMSINTSTGNIRAENISADALDLSVTTGGVTVINADCDGDMSVKVSTGKVSIADAACRNLISNGSTGTIVMKNAIAEEKFSIERSTGDVYFDGCDAAEISVRTGTGDVAGSLLTDKVFAAKTDTGRINVPHATTGGRCEIVTSTGNIRILIQ